MKPVGTLKEVLARLTAAFADVRKRGYVARQNFLCCASCAGARTAADIEKRIDARPGREILARGDIKGHVTYHRQAGEMRDRGLSFWLNYGQVHTRYGLIGVPAAETGKVVCEALARHDVPHAWDGSPDAAIEVRGRLWKHIAVLGDETVPFHLVLTERGCGAFVQIGWGNQPWQRDQEIVAAGLYAYRTQEATPVIDLLQERYPDDFWEAVRNSRH